MTLSDMAALVFGTALALALPWENHLGMIGVPEPRWVVIASFALESVEKACLALIPLAFWRRARLGGVLRPAELLLVVCASPLVVSHLDRAFWDAQGRNGIDYNGDLGDTFWWFRAVAWPTALAAWLGFVFEQRWRGELARSALLIVAVAALYPWLPDALLNVQEVTSGRGPG